MPKEVDVVKLAKDVSSISKVPLPKVTAVMQKHKLDGPGLKTAYEECLALGKLELEKTLKSAFNPVSGATCPDTRLPAGSGQQLDHGPGSGTG